MSGWTPDTGAGKAVLELLRSEGNVPMCRAATVQAGSLKNALRP